MPTLTKNLSDSKFAQVRLMLAIAWLVLLSVLMLTPATKFPEVDLFNFQDKLIHIVCFFIQAYLWCGVGVKKDTNPTSSRRFWIIFISFGILAGILLETAQQFIPFRSFDWMDMAVNLIGGILGLLGYLKWPIDKIILD